MPRRFSCRAAVGPAAPAHQQVQPIASPSPPAGAADSQPQPQAVAGASGQPSVPSVPRTELPLLASRVDLTMSIRFSGIFWPSTNRSALKNQWLHGGRGEWREARGGGRMAWHGAKSMP